MRSHPSQLLCVAGGMVHPTPAAWLTLVAWARRLPAMRVHRVRNVESILRLHLERFSSIMLYFHASHISDDALAALDTYVLEGGGLVAVHSAAASFEDQAAYSAILGGRFLRHGAVAPYSIRQTEASGAFAGGGASVQPVRDEPAGGSHQLAPAFPAMNPFTVRDELYVHEYDPDNFVHFVTDSEDGPEPVVWSRLHGKGRVFYLAPGHRAETLRNPAIRGILRNGIRWAVSHDPTG